MDIKDLKTFQTIAQERSITKASKILYMTPQGISKIIKKLETELGCTLFTRTTSGMKLTESGRRFQEFTNTATEEYNRAKSDILRIEQRHRMTVDLLSSYGILRLVTPDCLTAFRDAHPEITFHYREYPDLVTERYFAEDEGNVAFSIGDFDEALYDVTPLASFPIRLLVHETHPLASQTSVSIDALKGQPLYIESSQFRIHHMIVDRCRNSGFEPNIIFETSGFSLCHKMVQQNKGISVTVDFITDDMKGSSMKLIPFTDPTLMWKVNMITRKDESTNPAVRLFHQHIADWLLKLRSGQILR